MGWSGPISELMLVETFQERSPIAKGIGQSLAGIQKGLNQLDEDIAKVLSSRQCRSCGHSMQSLALRFVPLGRMRD